MVDQNGIETDHHAIAEWASAGPIEIPVLSHDAATRIGAKLSSKWKSLVGLPAPAHDDLIWADLVQFILYSAREHARDAERDEASK